MKQPIIAILIFFIAVSDVKSEKQMFFALVYHSFLGKKQYATDISIDKLKCQIESLKKNGFKFVSFRDIIGGRISGNKNILVTIDDGNESVYRAYKDVFKPLHIKPLLAIYPSVIGLRKHHLTWEELEELSSDGCDIASHGYHHYYLRQKLYNNFRESFMREIYTSRDVLEKRLKKKIVAFVYSHGVISDIAKKTIREAGYSCAFSIKCGPILYPLSMNSDPYELPRCMLSDNNWKEIYNYMLKN
jgi:peptidoglycan/xylan/chitin deacetylase (PgdA/CDA1 family)